MHWLGWLFHHEKALKRGEVYPMRAEIQTDQIGALRHQLDAEKRRNAQLILLNELSQQLETRLDQPVAAQMAVNTLAHAMDCSYACLFVHEPERREFVVLASAGRVAKFIPPGYRQSETRGMTGRAYRLRKTQISNNTPSDPDYFNLANTDNLSSFVVPVIHNGYIEGMIEISSEQKDSFQSSDVILAEMVASELERNWERSRYHQRLTDLIHAGISFSTMTEPRLVVQEIATVTRQALRARFVHVTLLDRAGNDIRQACSGCAPKLQQSLEGMSSHGSLLQTALKASQIFRVRDIRKYLHGSPGMELDQSNLRSLLAIPIHLHHLNIGSILAFGKQDEIFFTENDESLASLLSSQFAAAVESTWLYQELRSSLTTMTQLNQVSLEILRTEDLIQAARLVLETAHKVAQADSGGVVIFAPNNRIEIELGIDDNGIYTGASHPFKLIEQAMISGTSIFASSQTTTEVCMPIQTHLRKYGGLWLRKAGNINYDSRHTATLQTLANQLERAILLIESRGQSKELEFAYQELEATYDHTLAALMSALDARDSETEGHSARVSRLAVRLGQQMNLDSHHLKALERGALLHDIGKIGISDNILHKPDKLSEAEWKIMRSHPDIGEHIVEDIPFLQDTLPIIRYHQERWDGSGYPTGLQGKDIPLMARIFSVADTFDALTTERPYRERISAEKAVFYLREQAGILFDPDVVSAFEKIIREGLIRPSE